MEPRRSNHAMRLVTVASLLLAVGASIFSWTQYRLRLRAEAALRIARTRVTDSRIQPTVSAIPRPAAGAEGLPAQGSDDEKAIRMRYSRDFARQRATEAKMGAKAQNELMASREIQEQIARRFRENLPLRYGKLYAALKLNARQIEAFENAMMEKFYTMADVVIATRTAGASDSETADLRRRQLAEADAKLRLAIGDPLHREFLKYELAADSVPLVEALAGKMFSLEAPLTVQQGDELARIIAANAKALREDEWLRRQVFAGDNPRSWADVQWEPVIEKAAALLAPNQLATLRGLTVDAAFRREMEQRLRQADLEGRKAATAKQGTP